MPIPTPVPGLVIRYSYLWASEHRRGQEEGIKDRPCAVILVVLDDTESQVVTVLPITHSPPDRPEMAVELPHGTKQRLGLDDERSWIVVSEANRFVWPGPDLRLGPSGDANSIAFGFLPHGLFRLVRDKLVRLLENEVPHVVPRSE